MTILNKVINQTFDRMDLKQIRAFLFMGAEECNNPNEPYDVRLTKASDPLYERINSLYPDTSELTEATNEVSTALSTYQDVYMEIGMKAGARLLHQLLLENGFEKGDSGNE